MCSLLVQLAMFLQGTLYLALSSLHQLLTQRQYSDFSLLPLLTVKMLLLIQTLIQGTHSHCKHTHVKYRIRLIFRRDFISWKRANVDFTKFSWFLISRMSVWASFVLNLIFAGFNFANGHRLAK